MKYLTFILLLVSCAIKAQDIGGSYYISPTGSHSNPGTYAAPFIHLQQAINVATAGDTTYIRGGVFMVDSSYYGNNIHEYRPEQSIGSSGTAENPICYFNYPGETPIFDFSQIESAGNFNTGLNMEYVNYVNWRGFTFRNIWQFDTNTTTVQGISAGGCTNMTFDQIVIHNLGGRGYWYTTDIGEIAEIDTDTTRWINCDVYNCADTNNYDGPEFAGNFADGWKFGCYDSSYFELVGCRSWKNSDDGFDLHGAGIGRFDSCWAFSNGYLAFGNGSGIKVTGGIDSVPHPTRIITNCLAAFNHGPAGTSAGVHEFDYDPYHRINGRIYNNTSYKNDVGFEGETNVARTFRNTVYRNNIAYASTKVQDETVYNIIIMLYEYPESHNTWDWIDPTPASVPPWFVETDTVTVTDADFVLIDSAQGIAQLTAARQGDGSLPEITFLKLASTSDLIDAGTQIPLADSSGIVLSYNGSAPDIGFAEYEAPGEAIAPTPYTDRVTVDASDWVVLRGSSIDDGGGTVTEYGIVYAETENPTTADNKIVFTGGCYIIENLDPATTYYVRAYSINEAGTGYGLQTSFTTP